MTQLINAKYYINKNDALSTIAALQALIDRCTSMMSKIEEQQNIISGEIVDAKNVEIPRSRLLSIRHDIQENSSPNNNVCTSKNGTT